jgi:hypothetical protein
MAALYDFEGRWRVARQIEDRHEGRMGRFEGVVTFAPDGEGLVCREAGELTFEGGTPFAATRTYLWRQGEQGIEVHFEDGRFFHHIGPEQAPVATHWCDPDDYHVAYDFTLWPEWRSVWTVTGPRKDYTMVSEYMRIAP